MLYAAKSHIGLVRQMNQDGFAIESTDSPMTLFVIADGMGGASAGEVASRMAVDIVCQTILAADAQAWQDPTTLLYGAVDAANRAICAAADATKAYSGMGTTVVAALVDHQSVVIAHAGDSRLYGVLRGTFAQQTNDHSLVAELVRRGQLTEDEAQRHPQRHIVTRSLGTAELGYADIQTLSWDRGDVLLLCTDGLSNMVTAEELEMSMRMAAKSTSSEQVESIVESLLTLALERGGHDNITMILVVHSKEGGQA